MKQWVKNGLGIIIFLLLLSGIFMALQPLYRAISRTLHEYETFALQFLEEQTDIEVSYQTLSPSILTGIRIKGIVVKEGKTGDTIITIKKAVLGYNIFYFLKKDLNSAFTRLTVSDVDVNFESSVGMTIINEIKARLRENRERKGLPEKQADQLLRPQTLDTITKTLFSLPFDVLVRNTHGRYFDGENEILGVLEEFSLSRDHSDSTEISCSITGFFDMQVNALKGKSVGSSFHVGGKLLPDVSGSSIILSLDRNTKSDYTVNRMEFLLRYSDHLVVARSTQRLLPYALYAQFDLDSGELSVHLNLDSLNPFSIVNLPDIAEKVGDFSKIPLTTDALLSFNVVDKNYYWQAEGNFNLPKSILPQTENISFSLSGDNTDILISSLKGDGAILGAELSGNFNIPRLDPSAVLFLDHYTLDNGGIISGELYLEGLGDGYLIYVPQVFLGEQSLNSLQVELFPQIAGAESSADFTISLSDYSHFEFDTPSEISATGSVQLGNNRFAQAVVTIDSLFLDTAAKTAGFFLNDSLKQKIETFLPTLEPFVTSNELYISTDFKGFTFNSPYSLFANTAEDNQFLLLSFDGTEQYLSISQLDLIYGNQNIRLSLDADISKEDNQAIFSSLCNINQIPYQFNGIFTFGEWLNITGDYGLDATVYFSKQLSGHLAFSSFPVLISDYLLTFSTDTQFSYNSLEDFSVDIEHFSVEEVGGKLRIEPGFSFSGKVNNTGFVMDSLTYTDNFSSMEGSGYVLWNLQDGILNSVTLDVSAQNPLLAEKIDLSGAFTNPLHVPLSLDSVKSDCYFSAEAAISSFQMGRFLSGQQIDNTITGMLSASGTLENPYISLSLDNSSAQISGKPLIFHGNLAFLDNSIELPSFEFFWNGIEVKNIIGSLDLDSFTGAMLGEVSAKIGSLQAEAPFSISVVNDSSVSSSLIPEAFTIEFDSEGIATSLLQEPLPLFLSVSRSPGISIITSGENIGITGVYYDSGDMMFTMNRDKEIHFDMEGSYKNREMNFVFTDLFANIPSFSFLIGNDLISIYNGTLSGNLILSGLITDPSFDGVLEINDLEVNSPQFIPDHIESDLIIATLSQSTIEIPESFFYIKDSTLTADARVELDRWSLDSVQSHLYSSEKGFPIDINIPLARVKGRTYLDTQLLLQNNTLSVAGEISLNNSEISVLDGLSNFDFSTVFAGLKSSPEKGEKEKSSGSSLELDVDLDFVVGQKVNIVVNPILRGLVTPQTPIHFTMDTASETWSIVGDVVLRGGEVNYLSRNFYLKEGKVTLNESEINFDPILNVRAETRERDSFGNSVTISLASQNQKVSQFNPTLSAFPAKSENEIMALLGQVVTGDSDSVGNLLVAGGDYVVQVTLIRKLENSLRDLLNFDIFSVRTNVLQNAVKQRQNQDSGGRFTVSNYFDNSTVYVGKYFGSAIYADALLRWTYDEKKDGDDVTTKGLVFQPEFGFEMASPYVNIRLGVAPDIDAIKRNQWVPATSITLSWKHSF